MFENNRTEHSKKINPKHVWAKNCFQVFHFWITKSFRFTKTLWDGEQLFFSLRCAGAKCERLCESAHPRGKRGAFPHCLHYWRSQQLEQMDAAHFKIDMFAIWKCPYKLQAWQKAKRAQLNTIQIERATFMQSTVKPHKTSTTMAVGSKAWKKGWEGWLVG